LIGEIAALLGALALLIGVVGGLRVLYKPPAALRRFKLKDIEGEFQPVSVAVLSTPAPSSSAEQHGTAGRAPGGDTAEPQLPEQASAAEENYFPKIMDLFEKGEFKKGLELAKREIGKAKDSQGAAADYAFYLFEAARKGSNEAFRELEQAAAVHSGDPDVQYWWGASLSRASRYDDALKVFEAARSKAAKESDRVSAALAIARIHSQLERPSAAKAVLREELQHTSGPAERASLYVGLSAVYESDTPADQEKAFLMRELAIRSTPADGDLRFKLAYDYSKHGANELALIHYRALLDQNSGHVVAQNNAGVAADGLLLPLASVAYYEMATEAGSTLAAANLAKRMITAGLKKQAVTTVDEARKAKDVSREVDVAAGQLAHAEAEEETKVEQIEQRVKKVRKWRVEYAGATLAERPSPDDVSGSYAGVPSGLELGMHDDGRVVGFFRFGLDKRAKLTGTIEGSALTFRWSEVTDPKNPLGFLGAKAGHGVLLFRPALCANMSETVYPSGITVEGDQGGQHEFASRSLSRGR
jgi:tetratricopeptide (TPR) repeat protein